VRIRTLSRYELSISASPHVLASVRLGSEADILGRPLSAKSGRLLRRDNRSLFYVVVAGLRRSGTELSLSRAGLTTRPRQLHPCPYSLSGKRGSAKTSTQAGRFDIAAPRVASPRAYQPHRYAPNFSSGERGESHITNLRDYTRRNQFLIVPYSVSYTVLDRANGLHCDWRNVTRRPTRSSTERGARGRATSHQSTAICREWGNTGHASSSWEGQSGPCRTNR